MDESFFPVLWQDGYRSAWIDRFLAGEPTRAEPFRRQQGRGQAEGWPSTDVTEPGWPLRRQSTRLRSIGSAQHQVTAGASAAEIWRQHVDAAVQPILELRGLSRHFGGLIAVNDLSLAVQPGTIHGLIGPNGAGKTTTFNVISGFYSPTAGTVVYQSRDVSGMRTSALAALGLVRTFQGVTLFKEFTVIDNVRVGCHRAARAAFLSRILGTDRDIEARATEQALELLKFFGLHELRYELAANLSHGHARALGMAVAFAATPKLILLDEPFTGMNPEETRTMMTLIRGVRDHGVTIMLVEHDMQAVMGLCDTITVMNFGSLLTEGTPAEVRNDAAVIEAYLGRPDHAA